MSLLEIVGAAALALTSLWLVAYWIDGQRWFHDLTWWLTRAWRKAKGFDVAMGSAYWTNDFAFEPDRIRRSKPDLLCVRIHMVPLPRRWRVALLRFPPGDRASR